MDTILIALIIIVSLIVTCAVWFAWMIDQAPEFPEPVDAPVSQFDEN